MSSYNHPGHLLRLPLFGQRPPGNSCKALQLKVGAKVIEKHAVTQGTLDGDFRENRADFCDLGWTRAVVNGHACTQPSGHRVQIIVAPAFFCAGPAISCEFDPRTIRARIDGLHRFVPRYLGGNSGMPSTTDGAPDWKDFSRSN